MKRSIYLVTTWLVLTLVAVACGGGAAPPATPTDTAAPQARVQATQTKPAPTPTEVPPTPTEAPPTPTEKPEPAAEMTEIYKQSPWWPYISAHMNVESPPDVVGGPIELRITQQSGGANWVLPGPRKLDPAIFGTADNPKATEVPPIILGAPMKVRETQDDGTFVTNVPTPFGDKFASTRGTLDLSLVDATATDGATTKDQIDMMAAFDAPGGQGTYRVEVKKAAPHGWFIPTGGGVMTNFIQHGVTKWGTQLMPTEYSYASFWGAGDIYLNDEKIAEKHLVHGMLTEFVRKEPYDLAFDNEVNPRAQHFHLMVPPFTPKGQQSPVPTGFKLPNGMQQPFFHVMFPSVEVNASMLGAASAGKRASEEEGEETATSEMAAGEDVRTIEVTAHSFEFEPAMIQVEKGETVRFVVQSEDIYHTFSVKPSKDAEKDLFSLDLYPDEGPVEKVFTVQEAGTLYLYCHPHESLDMTGTIEVTP